MHVCTHTYVCLDIYIYKIKPTRNGFYVCIYIGERHLLQLPELRKLSLGLLKFSSSTPCFLLRMFLEGGWEGRRGEYFNKKSKCFSPNFILLWSKCHGRDYPNVEDQCRLVSVDWRKLENSFALDLYKLQLTYNAVRGFSHKSISVCELILIWYCQMSC